MNGELSDDEVTVTDSRSLNEPFSATGRHEVEFDRTPERVATLTLKFKGGEYHSGSGTGGGAAGASRGVGRGGRTTPQRRSPPPSCSRSAISASRLRQVLVCTSCFTPLTTQRDPKRYQFWSRLSVSYKNRGRTTCSRLKMGQS